MKKVMIKQEALESFTEILDDIQWSVKVELAQKECDKERINDLLDELKLTWADTYNSIDLQVSRSLRNLYGNYIKAKKAGDMEQAELYLDCYLSVKNRQERKVRI